MSERFSETGAITLDTNSLGAVTERYCPLDGSVYKSFYVVAKTGTHATHQIQLQGSPDGVVWFDLGSPVTGSGYVEGLICITPEIRVKVTVAEGSTSTCDVYLYST